jgi:hypothetical protein
MSVRDYGPAAPHGPNMDTDRHVATEDVREQIGQMSEKESEVFKYLLLPSDMYNAKGEYWADMPIGERVSFIAKVDNEEARKELWSIWQMMKVDPLSPVMFYLRNMVIPGAGLLLEG